MTPLAGTRALRRPKKVTPARWVAWQVVRRTFDEGAWTDRAFAGEVERAGIDGRERAFAQRLAWGTVQRARRLDHVIAVVGKRPLRKIDAPVLHALRIGAYELLETGDGSGQHAAVDQAVEIVRAAVGERAVAFANAVLRRVQVDGTAILAGLDPADPGDLATLLSFPEWIVERAIADFGSDGVDALAAQNGPVAIDDEEHPSGRLVPLRINTLHPDAEDADAQMAELAETVGRAKGSFAGALPEARLVGGGTGALSPLVERGLLVPQSLASMLVAHALDPQPGERVLDMCSAPGGKTTHIAALMQGRGEVLACDLHESRAASVAYLATRCHASIVRTRAVDATTLDPDADGTFDRVLLDAPCSGLGVLDRRPDSRWKRQAEDVADLAALQGRLLAAGARMLRPGGTLVYSTCTLLVEENEAVVAAASDGAEAMLEPSALPASIPEWLILPGHAHMARVWPHVHGSDGFFIARLQRRPAAP